MRGPQVTPGYLDPRHDRGAVLAGGWLDSGDLGRLDAEGYVWLTGRSKDLIIRGGHNIDPVIIEEALNRHPAVETAAAVGLPDTYAGELPMAFVQLRPGARVTAEELREFCRREIPEHAAVPVQVALIPVMPLTGVGKIYKPALRREAAQRAFEAAIAPLRQEGMTAAVTVRDDPATACWRRCRSAHRPARRGKRSQCDAQNCSVASRCATPSPFRDLCGPRASGSLMRAGHQLVVEGVVSQPDRRCILLLVRQPCTAGETNNGTRHQDPARGRRRGDAHDRRRLLLPVAPAP
jgi:hypothetical protein